MSPKFCTALLACSLAATATFAQTSAPPTSASQNPAFEVVSIRPSEPGARGGNPRVPQPDGYTAILPIEVAILIAYFPQGPWRGRVQGAPGWAQQDRYQITAKVPDAYLPEWTRQNDLKPEQQVLLQLMLQSMLADRCKLAFHRVPGSISGYDLFAGKHTHLTASTPGAAPPTGRKLSDGGVLVDSPHGAADEEMRFYNTTMAAFVEYMNPLALGHLVDKTGLDGHYDFALRWADQNSEHPGAIYPEDGDPLSHWNFNTLGLRPEITKTPVDNMVIDHIEKPSPN